MAGDRETEKAERMSCRDVRARLVDLLYAEVEDHDRASLTAHLEQCGECHAAWSELRSLSSALDRWTAPAPQGIAERVLALLAVREAGAARAQVRALALHHLLAFLLAGVAAAGLSLLLVVGGSHQEESPLEVGVVGALWTALYGVAGILTRVPRYRRLAFAALVAAGLSVLLAPALSMPAVIEACRRWLEAAQASVLLNAAIVLAGALYASTPVFLSGAVVTRVPRRGAVREALPLAGAYTLLLAPSVYLQCHALTLSLTAPWVAGVLLGSCLGSMGGVAVAARLRPATA